MAAEQKVLVNLSDTTIERVEKLSRAHDISKSEVMNRAVALYVALDDVQDDGGSLFVQLANGNIDQLRVPR